MAITTGRIHDRNSFLEWVYNNPRDASAARISFANVLASKASLTAVPFLNRQGSKSRKQHQVRMLLALWQNLLAHLMREAIDVPLLVARDESSLLKERFGNAGESEPFKNAADSADYAVSAHVSFEECWSSIRKAHSTFGSEKRINDYFKELNDDAFSVDHIDGTVDLVVKPLWRVQPTWWRSEFNAFHNFLNSADMSFGNWPIWLEW